MNNNQKHLCKGCIYCDTEKKKCYPNSKDCHSEYDLTEDDIYNIADKCDFYKKLVR